jgi:hypothetical protein
VLAIRLNNQPIFDPKRGIFRSLPNHTPKGLAKNGRAILIEVKGERGPHSDDELAFQKRCILAGAEYVVAKGD